MGVSRWRIMAVATLGLICNAAWSEDSGTSPQMMAFEIAVKTLEKSSSLGQYLKNLEGQIDPKKSDFIRSSARGSLAEPFRIRRQSQLSFQIEAKGQFVSIELKETSDEEPRFLVNKTEIWADDQDDPSVLYKKILAALPDTSSSTFDFWLPKAHAETRGNLRPFTHMKEIVVGAVSAFYYNYDDLSVCADLQNANRRCQKAKTPDPSILSAVDRVLTKKNKKGRDLYCRGMSFQAGPMETSLKTCLKSWTHQNESLHMTEQVCRYIELPLSSGLCESSKVKDSTESVR